MCEIGILQTLDNPYIVDYLETYQDNSKLYLIMENCTGGELIPVDKSSIIRFTEVETADIISSLLFALAHAH